MSVRLPALPARSGSAYVRLEYRRAMEIAVVGAAACVTLNGDGDVEAVPHRPDRRRSHDRARAGAEAAIAGKAVDEESLAAVAAGAQRRRVADQRRPGRRALPPPHRRRHGPPRRRGRASPARAASMSPSPPTAPRASARPSEAEPMSVSITLNVNGVPYPVSVEQDRTLVSVLRSEIGLTGTKEGCDDCECGACMVLVDGRPVNSCSYLAVQADGREVTTVEGLGTADEPHPLQRNILAEGGVQCGFCTPGHARSRRPRCWRRARSRARTRSASPSAATSAAAPATRRSCAPCSARPTSRPRRTDVSRCRAAPRSPAPRS